MRYRPFIMLGIVVGLLLLGGSDVYVTLSKFALQGKQGAGVSFAKAATDRAASEETVEKKYEINVYVDEKWIEVYSCTPGETIIITNNNVKYWTVEDILPDEANESQVVKSKEQIKRIGRNIVVTATQNLNIYGYAAMAVQEYGLAMSHLVQSWEDGNYPGNVGGVYQDGDRWLVYLTENILYNYRAIKSEALSSDQLVFQSCHYSNTELKRVKNHIKKEYMSKTSGVGIKSVSIACDQWQDGVTEPRVLVVLKELSDYHFMVKQMRWLYGGKVVVSGYEKISAFCYPKQIPPQPTAKRTAKKRNRIVVNWKKINTAGKYQIRIYRGKKVIQTASTSKTVYRYSLKSAQSQNYYADIRVYNKEVGIWSAWSRKIKI